MPQSVDNTLPSLGEHDLMIMSLVLLSFILPLAIFLTKVFFRHRRSYAAKALAHEFPVLDQSHTFLFVVVKYVEVKDSVSEWLSQSQYNRWRAIRLTFREIPSYLL